ncbi:MAG: hypothetical protein LLF76_11965 [Planctomycetaceae bacterium]|nr:hypothetical protein [Planctomycetaceae bacterium]
MKESPEEKRLEETLRSSQMVAGGFMGTDPRRPLEVIEDDEDLLDKLKLSIHTLGRRMHELTDLAIPQMGNWIDDPRQSRLRVKADDYNGSLVCPWPHPGSYQKRITTVKDKNTGRIVSWTDLNIHMIEAHGFFEGKGAFFRIEPAQIAAILFPDLT